jgi:hypothetical protein
VASWKLTRNPPEQPRAFEIEVLRAKSNGDLGLIEAHIAGAARCEQRQMRHEPQWTNAVEMIGIELTGNVIRTPLGVFSTGIQDCQGSCPFFKSCV